MLWEELDLTLLPPSSLCSLAAITSRRFPVEYEREERSEEVLQILRVWPVNALPGHQHTILFSAVFSSEHKIENLPTGQWEVIGVSSFPQLSSLINNSLIIRDCLPVSSRLSCWWTTFTGTSFRNIHYLAGKGVIKSRVGPINVWNIAVIKW